MTLGAGGATDADEDMAFALVMADKRWGLGRLNYASLAKRAESGHLEPRDLQQQPGRSGDSWGPTNLFQDIDISYFAPAYYRVFQIARREPRPGTPSRRRSSTPSPSR